MFLHKAYYLQIKENVIFIFLESDIISLTWLFPDASVFLPIPNLILHSFLDL